MADFVNVIGGGLAGSEAAYFLANHGIKVKLYEKRPLVSSPAHNTSLFGELVCSNSLKSQALTNACGLLKEEIKHLDSLIIEAAQTSKIESGDSLDVDRDVFANYITSKIKSHKNIEIINEDVSKLNLNEKTIVCTGPLTSESLVEYISSLVGEKVFHFFDASAPIIKKESIDSSKVFIKSRYDHGEGKYINCPMDKEQYLSFYNELINAKKAHIHSFDTNYFEGCLPIEVIASRGVDTLRFGPLKPVGLENEGKSYYAVVQLRQDDLIGNFYNLLGFQTNLTYGEQKRVFSMIPGLENAKFVRYGTMHRNTFLYSPKMLDDFLRLKKFKNIYIGGQLNGVEGYVESAATGLLAAYYCFADIKKIPIKKLSFYTILGALVNYITHTGVIKFQPMNANFGIIYKASTTPKEEIINRSLTLIDDFKKQFI